MWHNLTLIANSFDWEFLPLVLGLEGGATCCFGRGIAFLGATSDALGSLVTLLDPFLWVLGVALELLRSESGVDIMARPELKFFWGWSSYFEFDLLLKIGLREILLRELAILVLENGFRSFGFSLDSLSTVLGPLNRDLSDTISVGAVGIIILWT